MKTSNYFLLLLTTLISSALWSQSYTVSYDTAAFSSLSTFNIVDESNPDSDGLGNDLYQKIPIGFNFNFEGETFDSLMVGETGYARFRSSGIARSYISIFDCPLEDFNNTPSASPIVYFTTGTSGNRIFVLEFINKGFINDSEKNDSVHFQLWLYENCNDFEIRVGYTSIEISEFDLFYNMAPAPIMGYGINQTAEYYELTGGYSLPQLQAAAGNSLSIVPPSGTVYNFTKCSVGISDLNSSEFYISPNPTDGATNIQFQNGSDIVKVEVINMNGQLIKQYNDSFAENLQIDFSDFESGIYLIRASSKRSVITKKIVKQ
jgi:hypothetical protein